MSVSLDPRSTEARRAPGEVDVWLVPVRGDEVIARDRLLLDAEERDRLARLAMRHDRTRYAVAHAALRRALSRYAPVEPREWRFRHGPHGRPEIDGTPHRGLRFSLAHTHGLVAIAVTMHADVGLDAESSSRAGVAGIAEHWFAPSECDALARLEPAPRERAFLDYWTLKEAFLKANGLGLGEPLDGFAFSNPGRSPIRITFARGWGTQDPAGWSFALVRPYGTHAVAIAVRAPRMTLRLLDGRSGAVREGTHAGK